MMDELLPPDDAGRPRGAVQVLLDSAGDLKFDYAVPEEMEGKVEVGSRVLVHLRMRPHEGTVLEMISPEQLEGRRLRPLLKLLGEGPQLTPLLLKLAQWISSYYCVSLRKVQQFVFPEVFHTDKHRDKIKRTVRLVLAPPEEELAKLRKKAKRQAEIIEQLMLAGEPQPAESFPAQSLKALSKMPWVVVEEEQVVRDPYAGEEFLATAPLALTGEQQAALESILEAVERPRETKPVLLYGVTGSGKTEVYLQAVQRVLDAGKNVLVMVPGISLTPQTVDRFKSRFTGLQGEIAVLHSQVSPGERRDGRQLIQRGKARIVIGTRSAVFAPLQNVGLIIVDEEHESSYKQEADPRYHARDVAIVRATMEPCAIVLGSATPALESWYNAQKGKYTLVSLTERADGAKLPVVRVIDMRLEKKRGGKGTPAIMSEQLRIAVDKRLQRGEQTILFINRRGFAGSVQCSVCGHVVKCNHCSVSMTLHKTTNRLICHMCGFQRLPPKQCPECQDPGILFAGFGTQRAEEVMRTVFPRARIARMDTDITRDNHTLQRQTFADFLARKLDILVGTQMIARGLHFPGVTLVGILNADISLNLPDFRASERTFSLLTQVAGRAGRGELLGEVVVQTFAPHSPAIQYARQQDFEAFAEQELDVRRQCGYPPYGHAVLITCRGEHQRRTEFCMETVHKRLAAGLPDTILMGDPAPSPLEKSNNEYRFQLLLRARQTKTITTHFSKVMETTKLDRDVYVVVDVDPVSLT